MGRKSNAQSLKERLDEGIKMEEITTEHISNIMNNLRLANDKVAKYPDEIKLLALTMRSRGDTLKSIGEVIGVSEASVHAWVNDPRMNQLLLNDLSEAVKGGMSAKCMISANTSLANIRDEDYEKASLLQKGTFAAMMIDKSLLLSGEATDRIDMVYQRKQERGDSRQVINTRATKVDGELAKLKQLRGK